MIALEQVTRTAPNGLTAQMLKVSGATEGEGIRLTS